MHLIEALILILSSFALLIFPESRIVFQMAIFGGTVIAIHIFYRLMKYPNLVRFGNIACFSMLFGYVVSTAGYTVINLVFYGEVSYTQNVFGLKYFQSDVSHGLLIVIATSILLSAISHFERPLFLAYFMRIGLTMRSLWVIGVSSAIIVIGIINGDIGYMGIYSESGQRLSPLGALCYILVPPLTTITMAFLFEPSIQPRKFKKFILPVCAVLVIALIPLGRRVLMYTLMLFLILLGPNAFKGFLKSRNKTFHFIVILLSTSIILIWGFRAFYAMRITVNNMAVKEKPPIMEIVPYFVDMLQDSYALAEVHEKLIDNISERPFVLSYLAGLIAAQQKKDTPLFGELRHAIVMAIPSVLYPKKNTETAPASEEFIHQSLGLPVFDGPNTIVTAGLNDLGLMGIVIYPVGVVCTYSLLCRVIMTNCPPFLFLFIVSRLMYSLLFLEESFGALVGSGLRDLFIVALFYWILLKAPSRDFAFGRIRKLYE